MADGKSDPAYILELEGWCAFPISKSRRPSFTCSILSIHMKLGLLILASSHRRAISKLDSVGAILTLSP